MGQPLKIDDLTKVASVNENELGQKVAEIEEDIDKAIFHAIINLCGYESILPENVGQKGILGVIFILFLITHFNFISSFSCEDLFIHDWYFYFQYLFMLQLAATLKAKADLLEKEACGHLAASLAGSKTSDLWDVLEDLFTKMSEVGEEGSPPPKRSHSEDEPSARGLGSSVFTSTSKAHNLFPANLL